MSVTMIQLKSGMCRWPLNDNADGELRFCGEMGDPAFSYCEKHTRKAHAPHRAKKPE